MPVPTKPVPQNIIAIDILRAVAALGVFYTHNHLGEMLVKYTGLSFLGNTDTFGGTYAVPLFFLISGYCIHASNIKYLKANTALPVRKYYIRRFLRIFPPYLVAVLVALAVNYFVDPGYKATKTDLLVHLFSLQGFTVPYFNTINVVLWTISIELAFYAIYPLFYYIRFKYSLNKALLFTFIVSCISFACFEIKGDITLPERFCVFNLWFAWCCGAYLADKKMIGPDDFKRPVYLFVYLFVVIGAVCLKVIPNNLGILFDQFNILFWTAPMLFLLSKEGWLRSRKNNWVIKIISAIGISSYSLYLLHEPLLYVKNFLVHKYLPPSFTLAGVAIGIFVVLVIAWFSYSYIEKPFMAKKKPAI